MSKHFRRPFSSSRQNRLRETLYHAQSGLCGICGKGLESILYITIDHVFPRSSGGKNAGNRIAAHRKCNKAKADRQPTGCEIIWLETVNSGIAA